MQPREKPIRVSTEVTQICGQRNPTVLEGVSGTANTGGGGGGGQNGSKGPSIGSGGSGIVVLRYSV